ncbi:MAG: hypothetical protein PHU95_02245 [Candidatus Thermoplasmatota archaeon]|nr:hypothetical protein [Candidatus Thermoplasmatota archaeon]MDD5778252.1 hypothetical protein [Candidatus Thermoplasmatota archaeon]
MYPPKTEEERLITHAGRYGETSLPPRGTGLGLQPASKKLALRNSTVFILGIATGGFLTYFFLRPKATVGKARDIYAAFQR